MWIRIMQPADKLGSKEGDYLGGNGRNKEITTKTMSCWWTMRVVREIFREDMLMDEDLTKAMKATQSPIPMKSIRAQWPVSTQTQTT